MLRRTLTTLLIGFLAVLATRGAVAVWEEPQQAFPGGGTPPLTTGVAPQTRTGALTVSGGQLRGDQPSSFLPTTGSPVPRGSITAFGGTATATGAVAASVYGVGAGTAGGGLEIGVLGQAAVNGATDFGVYGSSGSVGASYNPLAWAGYFSGASQVNGMLIVQGSPGTCSNNPAQQCSNNADCGISGTPTCNGSTHPRVSVTGKSTFGGNPAAVTPGTLAGYAVRLTTGSTSLYQGAVVGAVTTNGANAEGQGVVGRINASVTCAANALCAGVYGTDGSTAYDAPGRWAGYFNGNINVDGTVSLNGSGTTLDIRDPAPLYSDPPLFANLPAGSLLGTVVPGGANTLWGVAYDGQKLWFAGWGSATTVARVDPASLAAEVTCTVVGNGRGLAFDGHYLWMTQGSTTFRRIDPATVTNGGSCNEASTTIAYNTGTFSPVVGSRLAGSATPSIWFGGSLGSGLSGTYLIEIDPASMALLSATRVTTSVSTPTAVLDDGTYVWLSGVTDSGTPKLARVRKSDKAVTVFDYAAANCPASKPTCLTGTVDTYRGSVYAVGSVWVSAREGTLGAQRLLRIDPANGALQDAFPAGTSYGVAYDGTWVWTVDVSAPFTLRGVRAYDGLTQSVAYGFAGANVREFEFDGTSLYVTEFGSGRVVKSLR